MRTTVTTRWAAKAGNSAAEYEDAWRVAPDVADGAPTADEPLRVAVADGASESLLAGRWAGILTDAFADAPRTAFADAAGFADTAAEAAASWPEVIERYVRDRERDGRPLRWYERPGLAKGAFATLLALRVDATGWHAAAIGDTCVFHVRHGDPPTAFPLTASADFGTGPALLASRGLDRDLVAERVRRTGGPFGPGDALIACTDALACWFLAQHEAGHRPWETLRDMDTDAFTGWLAGEREAARLPNDDVTVVLITGRDEA